MVSDIICGMPVMRIYRVEDVSKMRITSGEVTLFREAKLQDGQAYKWENRSNHCIIQE